MTSSNTYNYSLSIGEAVLAAYERCQIRAPSIRQEHMVTAAREVNFLFSEWSNRQPNLWKVELISTSLTQGTATYIVPTRVVQILDMYRSLNNGQSNQTDIYMSPLSRTEFASISSKSTQGPPNSYWFDRLESGTVTLWPVPDGQGPYTLNYYACVQMQDANIAGGETPDIPYLWNDAMVAGLALRVARVYKPELVQLLKMDYKEAWTIAAEQNVEAANFSISPNLGAYYRR